MGKRHLPLALVTCALLSAPPALATVIVINASSYAVGTNLTDPFPGITLEYASHAYESGPGFATSPLLVGTDAGDVDPALVTNTLGSYTNGGACDPSFNSECVWNAVYGVFSIPVYLIGVNTIGNADDPVFLYAYDARGHVMEVDEGDGECVPYPGGLKPGCDAFVQLVGASSTTTPISYFLVGSDNGAAYATVLFLGVQETPEPASIALFAAGLLGILLARRRRQRVGRAAVSA
jgi:hypothetical protein